MSNDATEHAVGLVLATAAAQDEDSRIAAVNRAVRWLQLAMETETPIANVNARFANLMAAMRAIYVGVPGANDDFPELAELEEQAGSDISAALAQEIDYEGIQAQAALAASRVQAHLASLARSDRD
jgi:hypothetical protein